MLMDVLFFCRSSYSFLAAFLMVQFLLLLEPIREAFSPTCPMAGVNFRNPSL